MDQEEESNFIHSFPPAHRVHVARNLREKRERKELIEDIAAEVVRRLKED